MFPEHHSRRNSAAGASSAHPAARRAHRDQSLAEERKVKVGCHDKVRFVLQLVVQPQLVERAVHSLHLRRKIKKTKAHGAVHMQPRTSVHLNTRDHACLDVKALQRAGKRLLGQVRFGIAFDESDRFKSRAQGVQLHCASTVHSQPCSSCEHRGA
eukprot:1771725-Pleurochrysis_carterae.AAC.1